MALMYCTVPYRILFMLRDPTGSPYVSSTALALCPGARLCSAGARLAAADPREIPHWQQDPADAPQAPQGYASRESDTSALKRITQMYILSAEGRGSKTDSVL